ncbi:MAG: ABC transporter permease subunit [Anaerolineales bacterium]
MTRFVLRRLIIIPIILFIVNFLGFSYAHYAKPLRAENTPYMAAVETGPLLPAYREYLQSIFKFDFSEQVAIPGSRDSQALTIGNVIWSATKASLGLLTLAITISAIFGFLLGMAAVRNNPPSVRRWLTWVGTVGLAMPSFYIGSLLIFGLVFYVIRQGPGTDIPVPIDGFGWDLHLVLPTIALIVRPTVQIAQTSAGFLSSELNKQYIVAARSVGHGWREIRNRYAMRNILAPIILMLATVLRLLVGDLVLVEWLFRWPGLGRLLAWTLVPPQLSSSSGSPLFLNAPVMATTLTLIAAFFLLTDLAAAILVRVYDPRIRNPESEIIHA